jgi:hypothetical protein
MPFKRCSWPKHDDVIGSQSAAFSSSLDLDGVVGAMSTGLRADRDLLVVGQIDSAALRFFGQLEHPDIFRAFFPAATKLL